MAGIWLEDPQILLLIFLRPIWQINKFIFLLKKKLKEHLNKRKEFTILSDILCLESFLYKHEMNSFQRKLLSI